MSSIKDVLEKILPNLDRHFKYKFRTAMLIFKHFFSGCCRSTNMALRWSVVVGSPKHGLASFSSSVAVCVALKDLFKSHQKKIIYMPYV